MLIGIVADDLTGAADAVAPFAAIGLRADVQWTRGGKLRQDLDPPDARAWCTGSRDRPPGSASAIGRITRAAVRRLLQYEPIITYKKIDSTLRGYLPLELDGMRKELPGRIAVICPAFPANGRTVISGRLCVHGQAGGSVRNTFGTAPDSPTRDLDLRTLRSSAYRLTDLLQEWRSEGVQTLFCDAETDADLDILACALLQRADDWLPVGSAGLSAAFARCIEPASTVRTARESVLGDLAAGPVVVLVGSVHGAARRQAVLLARRAAVTPIVVHNLASCGGIARAVASQLESGQRIVLVVTPDDVGAPLDPGFGAAVYKEFIDGQPPTPRFGLVLTGGHTALGLLSGIDGCDGLEIVGEMEAGIVLGRLRGSGRMGAAIHGRPVALKAGGFGDEDALARCVGLD